MWSDDLVSIGVITWLIVLIYRILSPNINDSDEMGCLIPILGAIAVGS